MQRLEQVAAVLGALGTVLVLTSQVLAELALQQSRQHARGILPDRAGRPDQAPDRLTVRL